MLEAENHVVLEADNGISALELLEKERVDAVISDILMPEMDGYRLCYEIRKSPRLRTLPFIVYSASFTSPSDEKVAMQFGVDKFLRKPASPDEIVKCLQDVIGTGKDRASRELQIPEEADAMREYSQVLVRKLEETVVDLSEANKNLAERTALAEFIAAVSATLAQTNDLREMLQRCCDAVVKHSAAALARIWTVDDKQNVLELRASSGIFTDNDGGDSRIPLGHSDIGLVASERRARVTTVTMEDLRIHGHTWMDREGTVTFAGYPLLAAEQLVGVMGLFSPKPLSQHTLDVVAMVAQNIAVGVQRQMALSDLRRSEERFRELAENINEIFFVAEPDAGPVHYVSPAYEGITGRKREFLYQNPHVWLESIHQDDRARVVRAFRDRSEDLDQEYRILRPDGSIRWLRSRAFPVKHKDGDVRRVVGISVDITKRKQAEEKVNQNLQRIRALHEIDVAINSSLDLNTVLQVRLEKIDLFIPYPSVTTVRLLNKETGEFELLACRNIDAEEWKREFVVASRGRARRVLETKVPVTVRNLADASTYNAHFYRRHGLISYASLPLVVRNEALGVFNLYTREEHEFTDQEMEFLTTLAGQAAVAIRNAQLYEQAERQLKRIEALREIEKSITSTLDLSTVLNVLMEKIDLFLTYPAAATVRLFDKNSGLLEPAAARNIEIEEWIAAMRGVQHNEKSYGKVVIEERAPVVIPNLQTDPRTQNPRFYHDHGLISYAGVPLIVKDEVLGVLGIYTKEERSFSNEEIELLMMLAGQAAIAIHNARLFEKNELAKREVEATNKFLDKSLNQLASLYTAMTPLAPSESLHEMMEGIIARLIDATGADAGLIRIWDKKTGGNPVIGQRGYSSEFVEALRPVSSEGAIHWVIEHGGPIIAPDIASEDRLLGKRQLTAGFLSCAILPLHVHDEVRGVIQISSRTRGYFDQEQKDHLLAVAQQMGIALENHELFYSLKAARDELERANRVKDEFLSVMSHELRTPLSVILGYSAMFQDRQLGPLTNEQKQAVDAVLRNSQELLEMIESIMDATKIEAGSMAAEMDPVSPSQLLQEIRTAYDFPIAKNVRLEWQFPQSLPLLWSDTRKLRQILTNLINNAIKFTEEGRIVIAAEEKHNDEENNAEHRLEFRVSDSGVGIPPEECDKIFERFHQVDSSKTRRYEGVGLGLYIVKSFAEMLGGRVSVCSELGKGSTFTVSLPIKTP